MRSSVSRPLGVLKNFFALRSMGQGSGFVPREIGSDDNAGDAHAVQKTDAFVRTEDESGGRKGICQHGDRRNHGGAGDGVRDVPGTWIENMRTAIGSAPLV